ncbi:MAG: hypothetical protein WCV68_03000 [Candidatus Paceibacterota bacterium]|jgi:hypothetical protein
MPDVVKQTTSDSDNQNQVPPQVTVAPVNSAATTAQATVPTVTAAPLVSREEKVRKAKIAMEGLDRTVRREATEKEEEASEEKQQLNRLLLSLDHEKELLELTWVNLDDKRTGLKKVLEPILLQEDAIQSEENQEEGQEDTTVTPKEKHEVEQKRWQTQEKRRAIEEEKWLVEEKITKIEDQIGEVKKKYQNLLNQEEEIRGKIQAIDEQILLQQEVMRQQHELEEQKRQQSALKQVEEERQGAEAERRRAEEIKKAEEDRKKAEELKALEIQKQQQNAASSAAKSIETLRRAEEEKQRQETLRLQADQARAEELKKKLSEAMDRTAQVKQASTAAPAPIQETKPAPPTEPIVQPVTKMEEANKPEPNRMLELERIRQENEEIDSLRQQKIDQKREPSQSSQDESTGIRPLRTLQSDMADALKNQQIDPADVNKSSKKTFPWLS